MDRLCAHGLDVLQYHLLERGSRRREQLDVVPFTRCAQVL